MPSDLLPIAVEAARAGAEELRRRFRRSDLQVAEKAHNDLVTAADRASEEAILAVLHRHRPQDAVLAEESGRRGGGAGEVQWIVDPLDGTANFAHGLPVFAVAVACLHGGELQAGVVLDPVVSTEAAGVTLLWGLVAFGQIRLRRIDGHRALPELLEQLEAA